MKPTPDTNVLVRLVVDDDQDQGLIAVETLERASQIAISVHALCELVWIPRGRYAMPRADIAAAIRVLIGPGNVVANRPAIEAGLALLEDGDFADGVIAFEGRWLGGEALASFDNGAVKLLERQGHAALLLS